MNPPSSSDFLLLSRGRWVKDADKADIEADIDKCYEIRPLESERGSAYRHTNETPAE
jgi:hypothetical protein